MLQNLAETSLGKHNAFSPRQLALKSKKKKFTTELEDKTNRKEDFLSFQRLFAIFDKPFRSQEALMLQMVVINKSCDGKEKNQPLLEVILKV